MGWRDAFEQVVRDMIAEEPGALPALYALAQQTNALPMLEVFGQPFLRRRDDLVDAYVAHHLHEMTRTGKLLLAQVEVGAPPERDAQLEENRRLLKRLPAPFQARLWCGLDEQDGAFEWTEPIRLSRYRCDPHAPSCTERCQHDAEDVPATSLPLEVGHTQYTTTLGHVLMQGGVARWPYKSSFITILRACPQWRTMHLRALYA